MSTTARISASPQGEFAARLDERPIRPAAVAAFLDGLTHAERRSAIRAARREGQRSLYEALEGFAELGLGDLVPASTAELETVRHYGRNTLPLLSHFEKRFCRPPRCGREGPDALYGFNFQPLATLTGPGYFVAREDPNRREVRIDYRELPDRVPSGWPEIRSNERGLARFVYGFMVDTLRRVSEHVAIGSAARRGRDLGSWFLLCRE